MAQAWVYDRESFFDFLGYMIVHAPDFPEEDFLEPHEQLTLESAFEELKKGLAFVTASHTEIAIGSMNNLLAKAYSCFDRGDEAQGTRLLQDLDECLHLKKHLERPWEKNGE